MSAAQAISFSAVVLAAGRGSRMGADKALLAGPDGRPLWARQREALARAGAGERFLSARPDQTWANDAVGFSATVFDAEPDLGPLSGMVAALERTTQSHLAVLAVDLPSMESEWFEILVAQCREGIGAVGHGGAREDFFEPLAAIYPREFLPFARAALARRELSLQRLLAKAVTRGSMHVCTIDEVQRRWFENWNEPGLGAVRTTHPGAACHPSQAGIQSDANRRLS